MTRFQRFTDALATTGGHILICVFVFVTGLAYGLISAKYNVGNPMLGDILATGAVTSLYTMFKTSGTNAEAIARDGQPYQPAQPPVTALVPPVSVAEQIPDPTKGPTL